MPAIETDAACFSARRSSARVELEADGEHVERQRELADDVEHRHARGRNRSADSSGASPAEQRRPEQEAGDHLGDHLRLARGGGRAARPAGRPRGWRSGAGTGAAASSALVIVEGGQYTPGPCPTGSSAAASAADAAGRIRWSTSSPACSASDAAFDTAADWFFQGTSPVSRWCRRSCWWSCWRRPAVWRSAAAPPPASRWRCAWRRSAASSFPAAAGPATCSKPGPRRRPDGRPVQDRRRGHRWPGASSAPARHACRGATLSPAEPGSRLPPD